MRIHSRGLSGWFGQGGDRDGHFPSFGNWGRAFLHIMLFVALVMTLEGFPEPRIVSASGNGCASSSPSSGAYSVNVCITAPSNGATLTGNVPVTATVTVTGTSPGIQRMVFTLSGGNLLTDFQSPYSFTLPTAKWADGSYSIQASALMKDGFTTAQGSVATSFKNGNANTPVNTNSFNPTGGTQPPSGSPFVVAAAGDGASGEANAGKVTDLIASWNPNLFLYLGDVYEKGLVSEFMNWYGSSTTFYGRFKTITDPTIGNHEYEANAAPGYFDYWNNVPNYYSFDAGGWHFISLNSTSQFNQTSTTSAQYLLLAQDLAANSSKCTIAYFHHPVYSVGPQGSTAYMTSIWSLMAQSGVTVVLTGHDHSYQRWTPLDGSGTPSSTGVTQFVVGTGGHGIQNFVRTDSRMVVGYGTSPNALGALRLELSTTGANYRFVNIAGTQLDAGTIPCNKTGGPLPTNTPTALPTSTPTSAPVPTATPTTPPVPTATPTGLPTPTATPTTNPGPTATPIPTSTAVSPTATPPPAGSILVTPSADAYVNSSSPTSNFGSATALRADASPILTSYLQFNVQGLSGAASTATLKFYANSSSNTGVDVRGVADNNWGEKTITYSNAPAASTTVAGSSGAFATGVWVSVDVTSLIQGNGVVSLAITTTSSTQISIASRETGANAPQLVIN